MLAVPTDTLQSVENHCCHWAQSGSGYHNTTMGFITSARNWTLITPTPTVSVVLTLLSLLSSGQQLEKNEYLHSCLSFSFPNVLVLDQDCLSVWPMICHLHIYFFHTSCCLCLVPLMTDLIHTKSVISNWSYHLYWLSMIGQGFLFIFLLVSISDVVHFVYYRWGTSGPVESQS